MLDFSEPLAFLNALNWNEQGLIPAVVQDAENADVLMVAWMDEQALRTTIATGQTHFYSRSRRRYWHKGETSGNTQRVISVSIDCDRDTLLILVEPRGPACHTGETTCFFRTLV